MSPGRIECLRARPQCTSVHSRLPWHAVPCLFALLRFRACGILVMVCGEFVALRTCRSEKVWHLSCRYACYAAANSDFTFVIFGSTPVDFLFGLMPGVSTSAAGQR